MYIFSLYLKEYSISTILQMVGRAGRPQFDTEATAVIMTRMQDKVSTYLHNFLTIRYRIEEQYSLAPPKRLETDFDEILNKYCLMSIFF